MVGTRHWEVPDGPYRVGAPGRSRFLCLPGQPPQLTICHCVCHPRRGTSVFSLAPGPAGGGAVP